MQVYLPIAEMSADVGVLLLLGGVTGLLSGMFGVGGGFLMTPLLIFIGVPPAVAVSSSANQIIASSVSGFMAHWRRHNVDIKMGCFLLLGGIVDSSLGVWLFAQLQKVGQVDLVIALCYVFFLGGVGLFMAGESARALLGYARARRLALPPPEREDGAPTTKRWGVVYFPRSRLHIHAALPIAIGLGVGVMVSLMGIGGGFFIIPAMLYVLKMPTNVVVGTSLFQIIFVTSHVTLLHALTTHTVDVLLALLLLCGSVLGAQIGTRLAMRMRSEALRGLLALIVLAVAAKLGYGLFATPSDVYSVTFAVPS